MHQRDGGLEVGEEIALAEVVDGLVDVATVEAVADSDQRELGQGLFEVAIAAATSATALLFEQRLDDAREVGQLAAVS